MDDDGDYRLLNFDQGVQGVTFVDDNTKYMLKHNDDDIIIYLLEDGKYKKIGPFKNFIPLGDREIIFVSPNKTLIKYISQMKNGDKNINIGYYDEIDTKLYIKIQDFYEKYGHILKKYKAGGKRYKKTKGKYSNKKRKSRKTKRRKH